MTNQPKVFLLSSSTIGPGATASIIRVDDHVVEIGDVLETWGYREPDVPGVVTIYGNTIVSEFRVCRDGEVIYTGKVMTIRPID